MLEVTTEAPNSLVHQMMGGMKADNLLTPVRVVRKVGSKGIKAGSNVASKGISVGSKGISAAGRMTRKTMSNVDLARMARATRKSTSTDDLERAALGSSHSMNSKSPGKFGSRALSLAHFRKRSSGDELSMTSGRTSNLTSDGSPERGAANASWGVYSDDVTGTTSSPPGMDGGNNAGWGVYDDVSTSLVAEDPIERAKMNRSRFLPNALLLDTKPEPIPTDSNHSNSSRRMRRNCYSDVDLKNAAGSGSGGRSPGKFASKTLSLAYFRKRRSDEDDDDGDMSVASGKSTRSSVVERGGVNASWDDTSDDTLSTAITIEEKPSSISPQLLKTPSSQQRPHPVKLSPKALGDLKCELVVKPEPNPEPEPSPGRNLAGSIRRVRKCFSNEELRAVKGTPGQRRRKSSGKFASKALSLAYFRNRTSSDEDVSVASGRSTRSSIVQRAGVNAGWDAYDDASDCTWATAATVDANPSLEQPKIRPSPRLPSKPPLRSKSQNEEESETEETVEDYLTLTTEDEYFSKMTGNHGLAVIHVFDETPEHQATSDIIDEHLARLIPRFGSRCKFYRMNVTLSPAIATKLGVTTLPALVPIRDGKVDARNSKVVPDMTSLADKGPKAGMLLQAFVQLFAGRASRSKSDAKKLTGWAYPAPVYAIDDIPLPPTDDKASSAPEVTKEKENKPTNDDSPKASNSSSTTDKKKSSSKKKTGTPTSKTKKKTRTGSSRSRSPRLGSPKVVKGEYRTISQNDFNSELTGNHGCAILHFFDSGSDNDNRVSAAIDRHLDRLLPTFSPSIKFLRMSGALAPFIAPNLGVTSFPALIALRDGKVEFRLDSVVPDVSKLSEAELESGKFVEEFVQLAQGLVEKSNNSNNDKKKTSRKAPSRKSSFSGKYRTITQHNDCLTELTGNHGLAIVHFFDPNPVNDAASVAIDRRLKRLSPVYRQTAKFLRISGTLALFAAPELGVTQFPTVLILQDGIVKARLSDVVPNVSGLSESELQEGRFIRDFVLNFIRNAFPDVEPVVSPVPTVSSETPSSSTDVPNLAELYGTERYEETDLEDAVRQFASGAAATTTTSSPKTTTVKQTGDLEDIQETPDAVDVEYKKKTNGHYREVTQENFFAECSKGCSLVHFFDNSDSATDKSRAVSKCINQYLDEMAMMHGSTCILLRINGTRSPLCAQALGVKKFPAFLAMKNGLVQYRFSEVVPEAQNLSIAEVQNGTFLEGFLKEFVLATGYIPRRVNTMSKLSSFRNASVTSMMPN